MRYLLFVLLLLAALLGFRKEGYSAASEETPQYNFDNYSRFQRWRMQSYPYHSSRQRSEQLFSPQPRKPLQTTPTRFRPNPTPSPQPAPAPTPAPMPAPINPPAPMAPHPIAPPPPPSPTPTPMTSSREEPAYQKFLSVTDEEEEVLQFDGGTELEEDDEELVNPDEDDPIELDQEQEIEFVTKRCQDDDKKILSPTACDSNY